MKTRFLLMGVVALASCQWSMYETYFQSAEGYFRNDDLPRAVEMYLKAIRENGGRAEAYFGLALAHYRSGDEEDALYAFEKTLELDPQNVLAMERLASIYLDRETPDSAVALCTRALQRANEFPGALNTLGHALLALGEIDSAEKTFSASVVLCRRLNERYAGRSGPLAYGPEESEAFNGLGEIEFTRTLFSHALEFFDAAIALCPSWDRPWFNKAVAYEATKNFSSALVAYQRTIDLSSANLAAYRAYARLLVRMNQEPAAVDLLLRALRVDSTDVYSAYALGEIYERHGELAQALKIYEYVLSIYPDDAAIYVRLGRIQFKQHRIEESIASLQEALDIQPEYVLAYDALGGFYHAMGNLSQAERSFRSAIEIDSALVTSLVGLARVLTEEGRRQEGFEFYLRAAALGDSTSREIVRTQLWRKHP